MRGILANLDFETVSTCNRTCPTCLRNSYKDRDAAQPWFEPNYLPEGVIYQAISEMVTLPFFSGVVCLNHYDEPLTDERITSIVRGIKERFELKSLYFHSNGDLMTDEIAKELDGVLDRIVVTLYMDEPVKSRRAEWVRSLFHKTHVDVITQSEHIATHYSPKFPIKELIEKHKMHTCFEPNMRVVINHRRQYLLCCDDFVGHYNLGTFPEKSIAQHWDEKMKIQQDLSEVGGRLKYPYCATCPRT